MKRRLLPLLMLALLCALPALAWAEEAAWYQNPIAPTGNDPYLIQHEDTYYYIYTRDTYLCVARVEDPTRLNAYPGRIVWVAPKGTLWSKEYWAPELHYIRGEWYIYVTASDGLIEHHRMYVLKGTSQDPTHSFEMVGKITDPSDQWAIDGTVLQYQDELYMIWSGLPGDSNIQNLYIAHMADPCTIDSGRVLLSTPEKDWERAYSPINEGPQILMKGDTVHIVYSASNSGFDDYCPAALTYRPEQGDIMDRSSWIKSEQPLMSKAPGSYGPGHCSFIQSPDRTEDYIVYHANEVSGSGWGGRSVRMQKFTWEGDMPVLGQPVPVGQDLPLPSGTVR